MFRNMKICPLDVKHWCQTTHIWPCHQYTLLYHYFFLLLFSAKRCDILVSNRHMKIWFQYDRHWWQLTYYRYSSRNIYIVYLKFLNSSHWWYNTVSGFIVIWGAQGWQKYLIPLMIENHKTFYTHKLRTYICFILSMF